MKTLRPALVVLPLLSCALASVGCVDVTPFESEPGDAPITYREIDSDYIEACPESRQIARAIDPDECPAIDGWVVTSLFQDGSPFLKSRPNVASDPLGHFCRYEWDEAEEASLETALDRLEVATTGLPASEGHPGAEAVLHDVSPDCEVVRGQRGSISSDVVGPMVRDMFREQIGWVPATALPAGSSDVIVAVVDTMPYLVPLDPRSEHGELMARIVEDVACPGGPPCDVTVARVLGLPRHSGGEDRVRGGYVGSHDDLAVAITEAVEQWRATYPGPSRPPLIVNMSVAWEADLFGGDQHLGAQAVETALEYASCGGALIVAATGNASETCQDGAMLPARWEEREAPSIARCLDLGFPLVELLPLPPEDAYRPLVYAVGGLDIDGEDMPGSRAQSMPRMAAASTHAIAGESVLTTSLTGTSVGSAAVSGAAALLWSYDTSLRPYEVMETLYAGSNPLGRAAEVHLGGGVPPEVHGLDVCGALQYQCDQNQVCAAAGVDLGCSDAGLTDYDAVVDAISMIPVADTRAPNFVSLPSCPSTCGVPTAARSETSNTCADFSLDPTVLLVSPQPNLPACPTCALTDDDDDDEAEAWQVHASLDEFYVDDDYEIERVVVSVTTAAGIERFDFGHVDLRPDAMTVLELGDWVAPGEIKTAEFNVYFTGKAVPVTNDIIVKQ